MNTVLGIVLVLGVMILVHEWGHFIVARLFGVRVDVFSIGFGPRLFGWKRGATDYRISALPLGGYVRMAGQDITEIDSGEKGPTGAPDEVMSKPRWQRALISFAGPAVNLVMPILLLGGFYVIKGFPYRAYLEKPIVLSGLPENGPLAKAGVQDGDQVVAINGMSTPDWKSVDRVLPDVGPKQKFTVSVASHGATRDIQVDGADVKPGSSLFGDPPAPAVVGELTRGMPAKAAGLKKGDLIVAVNGVLVRNWFQCVDLIKKTGNGTLTMDVQRDGNPVKLQIHPVQSKDEDGQVVWKIGVGPEGAWLYRPSTFASAFARASRETVDKTQSLLVVLGRLFTGKLSVDQLQGFVGIAVRAGEAVQSGPVDTIFLMAMISLNLGILNLLPIPILDGGHILLLSIEGVRRKDLSLSFKERFIQVGFVFLLLLFAFVMYNDVRHLLPMHT
ncbi:MAG: RIP metalloprotease RseP [Candidatus Acidiferrum sp.]